LNWFSVFASALALGSSFPFAASESIMASCVTACNASLFLKSSGLWLPMRVNASTISVADCFIFMPPSTVLMLIFFAESARYSRSRPDSPVRADRLSILSSNTIAAWVICLKPKTMPVMLAAKVVITPKYLLKPSAALEKKPESPDPWFFAWSTTALVPALNSPSLPFMLCNCSA
jgi:hypothetical protein